MDVSRKSLVKFNSKLHPTKLNVTEWKVRFKCIWSTFLMEVIGSHRAHANTEKRRNKNTLEIGNQLSKTELPAPSKGSLIVQIDFHCKHFVFKQCDAFELSLDLSTCHNQIWGFPCALVSQDWVIKITPFVLGHSFNHTAPNKIVDVTKTNCYVRNHSKTRD